MYYIVARFVRVRRMSVQIDFAVRVRDRDGLADRALLLRTIGHQRHSTGEIKA
jgi:hypothetical protein